MNKQQEHIRRRIYYTLDTLGSGGMSSPRALSSYQFGLLTHNIKKNTIKKMVDFNELTKKI